MPPKITQWVLSTGIVQTRAAAEYVLLGFIIVVILASFFLYKATSAPNIPSEARENPEYGYVPNET